jgi:aminopeptidase-like protein
MDVARQLLKRKNLRYTYRYLILPETIGGVAYLSQDPAKLPRIKGGLFLEMLGLENPNALQLSFDGKTEVDSCFALALEEGDPSGWTGAYRSIIGNDERQFNGRGPPPMLSLSRVRPGDPNPYRVYHSTTMTLRRPRARTSESVDLVLRMSTR